MRLRACTRARFRPSTRAPPMLPHRDQARARLHPSRPAQRRPTAKTLASRTVPVSPRRESVVDPRRWGRSTRLKALRLPTQAQPMRIRPSPRLRTSPDSPRRVRRGPASAPRPALRARATASPLRPGSAPCALRRIVCRSASVRIRDTDRACCARIRPTLLPASMVAAVFTHSLPWPGAPVP